ncbi:MAG: esterase, partial [Bacteroidales bacterium]|nr:esterase [Bacteroidales bacterium]
MRKFVSVLMLLLAWAVSRAQEAAECTIRYKGHDHTYYLYIPSSAGEKCPLVMVLHGYGGKAKGYRPEMMEVAAEEGFALCYPQGEANSVGKTGWNVGYPSQADLKSDDIAYIR